MSRRVVRAASSAFLAATLLADGTVAATNAATEGAASGRAHRDLSCVITPGKRAVAVRVRSAEPVCGLPVGPGDYVDVRASTTTSVATNGPAHGGVLLRQLLVLAVEGDALSGTASSADGRALTLSVGLEDVPYLALAEEGRGLSLSSRGADGDGTSDGRPTFSAGSPAGEWDGRPR